MRSRFKDYIALGEKLLENRWTYRHGIDFVLPGFSVSDATRSTKTLRAVLNRWPFTDDDTTPDT